MSVDDDAQFEALKKIGEIVANCLVWMKHSAKIGMTTAELDEIGAQFLREHGALSAPQTMYNFPGATCISVEHEGVHGVPGDQILQEGHLINIDVSAERDGFFADTGGSFVLGAASNQKNNLCVTTQKALKLALKNVTHKAPLNQMGKVVQNHAEKAGLTVVRNVGGHGVGRSLHEAPEFIANYYNRNDRRLFKENMVVAIEPILSTGAHALEDKGDGWTLHHPRFFTAQFEHTVMVTKDRPYIFTQPTKTYG